MSRLIGLLVLFGVPALLQADCRRVVVRNAVEAVVVREAVILPLFSSGYAQLGAAPLAYTPQPSAAQSKCEDVLKEALLLIRELRAELRGKGTGGPVNAAELLGSDRGCVKCHQASLAAKSGGAFVLFEDDGKVPVFSLNEKNLIRRKIMAGQMPPPKSGITLSEAEKAAVVEFMTQPIEKK